MGTDSNVVTFEPGDGKAFRVEAFQDTDGSRKFAVINTADASRMAVLSHGDTLDTTKLGKDATLTVADGLHDDKGKPLIRLKVTADEKEKPTLKGPFEETTGSVMGDVFKQAMEQYRQQEDAKKTAKIQAEFDANLVTGQDPQIAMLAAVAKVDPDQLKIRRDTGHHDHNSITAPAGAKAAPEPGKGKPSNAIA